MKWVNAYKDSNLSFKVAQSTILSLFSRFLPFGWRDGLPGNLEGGKSRWIVLVRFFNLITIWLKSFEKKFSNSKEVL
jgi:hypothetical protein